MRQCWRQAAANNRLACAPQISRARSAVLDSFSRSEYSSRPNIDVMPRFTYVALDARGQESTGLVEASSTSEAIGQLRQAGYFPTNVYEEGKGGGPDGKTARKTKVKAARAPRAKGARMEITSFQRKKVQPKIMMLFTRQLATLID